MLLVHVALQGGAAAVDADVLLGTDEWPAERRAECSPQIVEVLLQLAPRVAVAAEARRHSAHHSIGGAKILILSTRGL